MLMHRERSNIAYLDARRGTHAESDHKKLIAFSLVYLSLLDCGGTHECLGQKQENILSQ